MTDSFLGTADTPAPRPWPARGSVWHGTPGIHVRSTMFDGRHCRVVLDSK